MIMNSIRTERIGEYVIIDKPRVHYVPDWAGDCKVICFSFTNSLFYVSKVHLKTAIIIKRVDESYEIYKRSLL